MNIPGVLIGILFSYHLARNRQFINPLMPALVTLACILVVIPTTLFNINEPVTFGFRLSSASY
jgi:PTS system cellobiose-specific IIC component